MIRQTKKIVFESLPEDAWKKYFEPDLKYACSIPVLSYEQGVALLAVPGRVGKRNVIFTKGIAIGPGCDPNQVAAEIKAAFEGDPQTWSYTELVRKWVITRVRKSCWA